jgi:TRAP transporter 4TM/12TM fusion protein
MTTLTAFPKMAFKKPGGITMSIESPPATKEKVTSGSLQRKVGGFWKLFSYVVAAVMALFHIYILGFQPMDPWLIRIIHIQFVMAMGFTYYAGWSRATRRMHPLDLLLILLSLSTMVYVIYCFDDLVFRAGVFPEGLDVLFGLFAVVTVIELTRRTVGMALIILVLMFIMYCFIGPYLPGIFWHRGFSFERVISYLFSINGIYNIPLGVTARFVYIFILFGAFLELSGAAGFFMDTAFAVAGKTRGGPAKVAVIASGLFGMVNGTSTGNVVTTGTLTIPMMKKVGYEAHFAGAVEACASTGGQIMPPVMGAAVFLMASLIERPYAEIMIASFIPAMLYYVSIFIMVDMESVKKGLSGLPADKVPNLGSVLKQAYLAIPIVVLLYYLVFAMSSVVLAGLMALATAFIMCFVHHGFKGRVVKFGEILDALHSGAKNVIQVSVTCASAGIIMGSLTLSGLGMKIATIVINMSHGNLLFALILTMSVTIILGMGLPTIAAYAITASVVAPALIKMGVPEIPAHLFVLYFASLSAITPPVALASYAAAAIAGVSPLRLAFIGMRLGLAGFIIPFMFVYGQPLLLMGSVGQIILSTITGILGVFCLAVAIEGHLWRKVSFALRLVFFIASLALIKPGLYSDLVGIAFFLLAVIVQRKLINRGSIIFGFRAPETKN